MNRMPSFFLIKTSSAIITDNIMYAYTYGCIYNQHCIRNHLKFNVGEPTSALSR